MRIKQIEQSNESRPQRKTWYVDGHEFTTSRAAAEYIMLGCPCEHYDEYLDTQHGDVDICGHIFTASESLFSVSRGAYWEGFQEWKNCETENVIEELQNMIDGESTEIFDLPIICETEELKNGTC